MFPEESHGLPCMAQLSTSVPINLLIDPLAYAPRRPLSTAKPEGRQLSNLSDPNLLVPDLLVVNQEIEYG